MISPCSKPRSWGSTAQSFQSIQSNPQRDTCSSSRSIAHSIERVYPRRRHHLRPWFSWTIGCDVLSLSWSASIKIRTRESVFVCVENRGKLIPTCSTKSKEETLSKLADLWITLYLSLLFSVLGAPSWIWIQKSGWCQQATYGPFCWYNCCRLKKGQQPHVHHGV